MATIDEVMDTARTPKAAEILAAVRLMAALAEAIRTGGPTPSGQLYAMVCGSCGLPAYQGAIATLKRAGLVRESGHPLEWCGPVIDGEVK